MTNNSSKFPVLGFFFSLSPGIDSRLSESWNFTVGIDRKSSRKNCIFQAVKQEVDLWGMETLYLFLPLTPPFVTLMDLMWGRAYAGSYILSLAVVVAEAASSFKIPRENPSLWAEFTEMYVIWSL